MGQLLPTLTYGCELYTTPLLGGGPLAASITRWVAMAYRGRSTERVSQIVCIDELSVAMAGKWIRWAASQRVRQGGTGTPTNSGAHLPGRTRFYLGQLVSTHARDYLKNNSATVASDNTTTITMAQNCTRNKPRSWFEQRLRRCMNGQNLTWVRATVE